MSQPSQGQHSSITQVDPRVKRKRGRPRKDESLGQGENMIATPVSDVKKNKGSAGTSDGVNDMVGQMVFGVIEGSFGDGYFLRVKVGDSDTQLKGVVFLPGRVTPITPANDVAPHVKMYKRKDVPFPAFNPYIQHHGFNTPSEHSGKRPVDIKDSAIIYPDQVPVAGLQSGVPGNQSPIVMESLVAITPKTETDQSLEGNVISQQTLESGPENQQASVMAQLEHHEVKQVGAMEENEVSTLMKGPDIDVKATKVLDSEPAAEPYIGTSPATETVNQEPQVQHQAVSSDLKLGEFILDEVKGSKFEFNPTFVLADPKLVPSEPVTKPGDIQIGQEPSPMKIVPQDTQNLFSSETMYVPSEDFVFGEPKFKLTELISNPVNIMMEKEVSPVEDVVQDLQNSLSAEFASLHRELTTEPVDILKEKFASPNLDILQETQNGASAEVRSVPLEMINCVSVEPKTVPLKLNSEPVDVLMEKQASPLYMQDPVFGEQKSKSLELVFKPVDATKDVPQDTQPKLVADSSSEGPVLPETIEP